MTQFRSKQTQVVRPSRDEDRREHLNYIAGHVDYMKEACKRSKEIIQGLVKRGVVVVAFASYGKKEACFGVSWLDEHKNLAGVANRFETDGRVRGSGVGYPPRQAFVARLPPVKGIGTGLLNGMDASV
ncbi:hypothetical protein Bca52824_075827 [Brassica carinata]|uniref:Uncharacterized protein n=1 Tax=Brassica carinata TaxID=52824 RepID=A0A8X7PTW0_BRACI|nr:hypothetical protein Bca52824_075827 [Brassica carinata]